jgi:hypothetical protein
MRCLSPVLCSCPFSCFSFELIHSRRFYSCENPAQCNLQHEFGVVCDIFVSVLVRIMFFVYDIKLGHMLIHCFIDSPFMTKLKGTRWDKVLDKILMAYLVTKWVHHLSHRPKRIYAQDSATHSAILAQLVAVRHEMAAMCSRPTSKRRNQPL